MTLIPLVRMLTDAGYGSRRDVSQFIKAGQVEVNGAVATSYTEKVDPAVDSILVSGKQLSQGSARRVYLMMNKPEGYLSSTEDDRDRPTVLDLLPGRVRTAGLHPAGRLDEDSTGLIVLTNDGQLTYELTHPRFEHEKEYWVATTGRLTDADVEQLEQGVEIDGQMTWPAKMRILLGHSPYTYSITIHEGRKRQVRMMFAAIMQQVALLKRVRLGGLLLGDLKEGEWREMTQEELRDLARKRPLIRSTAGLSEDARRIMQPRTRAARARPAPVAAPLQERADRAVAEKSSSFHHEDGGAISVAPSRRTDDRLSERPYGGASTTRVARYYDAEDRGSREGVRRLPSHGRDDSSYPRPDEAAPRGRAYERPRRQDGAHSADRSRPVRETGPQAAPDARDVTGRGAGMAPERPYQRPTTEGGARPYARREQGAGPERPYRRPPTEGGARPYARREQGAGPERPYRRPVDEGGARPYARREPGTGPARPYRRPPTEGGARPYARREQGAGPERPYRRPPTEGGARPYTRRTEGGAPPASRFRDAEAPRRTEYGRDRSTSERGQRPSPAGGPRRSEGPPPFTRGGGASRPPRPRAPEGRETPRRTSPSTGRTRREERR